MFVTTFNAHLKAPNLPMKIKRLHYISSIKTVNTCARRGGQLLCDNKYVSFKCEISAVNVRRDAAAPASGLSITHWKNTICFSFALERFRARSTSLAFKRCTYYPSTTGNVHPSCASFSQVKMLLFFFFNVSLLALPSWKNIYNKSEAPLPASGWSRWSRYKCCQSGADRSHHIPPQMPQM